MSSNTKRSIGQKFSVPQLAASAWLVSWFGVAAWIRWATQPQPFELDQALLSPTQSMSLAGADTFGRNLLPLTSSASLLSFGLALGCVAVSIAVALLVAAAGMSLGRVPQRWLESSLAFLLAFPSLLFALAVGGILGPGRSTVAIAIVLGSAPGLARTLWVRAREIEQLEFIWAARSLGARPWRLMRHHFMPHLLSLARVKTPSLLSHALIAEASLSFLGLGFPVGEESWGSLLAQGRDYLIEAPHIAMGVGVPLALTLLALDVISKPRSGELR